MVYNIAFCRLPRHTSVGMGLESPIGITREDTAYIYPTHILLAVGHSPAVRTNSGWRFKSKSNAEGQLDCVDLSVTRQKIGGMPPPAASAPESEMCCGACTTPR